MGVTHGFAKNISGYVRTSSGNGLSGVTVRFDNGGGTDTTNSSGYSREVTYGWSGTVTPTTGKATVLSRYPEATAR